MNEEPEKVTLPDHFLGGRRLLTIKEAARMLGCSEGNVYALKEAGVLPFVTIGVRKGIRIDAQDLDKFIEQRKYHEVATPVKLPRPRLKHLRLPR